MKYRDFVASSDIPIALAGRALARSYSRFFSLCRRGILLAPFHFAAHSHSLPRAILHELRRMC